VKEEGFENLHLALARLPPGRHGLPREFVIQNQRSRILLAMTRIVAEVGYAKANVPRVVAEAAISRRTFFEHFEGKADCFAAVYELAIEQIVKAGLEAVANEKGEGERQLGAGLEAALGLLAREPELARICMLESLVAKLGSGGSDAFLAILAAGDPRHRASTVGQRMTAGGIAAAVRERVRLGELEALLELAEGITEVASRIVDADDPVDEP